MLRKTWTYPLAWQFPSQNARDATTSRLRASRDTQGSHRERCGSGGGTRSGCGALLTRRTDCVTAHTGVRSETSPPRCLCFADGVRGPRVSTASVGNTFANASTGRHGVVREGIRTIPSSYQQRAAVLEPIRPGTASGSVKPGTQPTLRIVGDGHWIQPLQSLAGEAGL